MATEISKNTPDVPLHDRIIVSVAALAICWLVSGVGFGLYLRDPKGSVVFFIWSVPFFAAGWAVMGIPVIAMDNRILKVPKLLLGLAGAVVGACIMLLPFSSSGCSLMEE